MTDTKKNEVAVDTSAIERLLMHGDLSKLTEPQRLDYYRALCESVGLNPLTQPFEYVKLNGKLVLYCRRAGAEQLRKIHGVSIRVVSAQAQGDLFEVHVSATDRTGRVDEDFGYVPMGRLVGEAAANAKLKAITKAKRRVTLSLCGLGMLDETEIESALSVQPVQAIANGGSRADAIAASLDLPNPEPAEIEHNPEPAELDVSQEREPTLFERIEAAGTPLELSCLLPDLKGAAERHDESMVRDLRIAYKQRMDALEADAVDGEEVEA